MPPPQASIALVLGIGLGFIARPFIMGCFSSKEAERAAAPSPLEKPAATPPHKPAPAARPSHVDQPAAEKVFRGQYGGLEVTDADRAQLKAKHMRDKLHTFLVQSDTVLKHDLVLAQRARAEGNDATARVIMHRRALLKRRVQTREASAKLVLDMVDAMDSAVDQKKMLKTIEEGTQALSFVLQDLSVEKVEKALADSNAAVAYTNELSRLVAADTDMSDADLADAYAELDQLEAEQEAAEATDAPLPPADEATRVSAAEPSSEAEPSGAKHEQPATTAASSASPASPATYETALEKAENIPDVPSDLPAAVQLEPVSVQEPSAAERQPELV